MGSIASDDDDDDDVDDDDDDEDDDDDVGDRRRTPTFLVGMVNEIRSPIWGRGWEAG